MNKKKVMPWSKGLLFCDLAQYFAYSVALASGGRLEIKLFSAGELVGAMGLMAGPALLKRGYDKSLSAGIICSSGTLGILIPPSIMLVVYGGLTGQKETSIGNLFAVAILPGLFLSGLYLLYVGVRCYLKPKVGPPIPSADRTATVMEKVTMTLFIGGKFFSVVFLSKGGGDVVADVLLGIDVNPYVLTYQNHNTIDFACIVTGNTGTIVYHLFYM